MIEQPRDSSFFKFPPVNDVLGQIGCKFYRVLQCHYGAELEKATVIATTIPSKYVNLNGAKADRSNKRTNKFWEVQTDRTGTKRWFVGDMG